MATPADLARSIGLESAAVGHLQRLVASWGLLSDLCFADLLLYAPANPRDPPAFIILGQVRPTTSQTLYREDEIGGTLVAGELPLVARAFQLGEIIDGVGTVPARGELATVQCIPVRWKDAMLAVLTRESAPMVGRRQGELERVYVEMFDGFARMITVGDFPFGAEETEVDEAPRVGDGVARLDASARMEFASPNFVSALHRMGIHGNAQGARLGEPGDSSKPSSPSRAPWVLAWMPMRCRAETKLGEAKSIRADGSRRATPSPTRGASSSSVSSAPNGNSPTVIMRAKRSKTST